MGEYGRSNVKQFPKKKAYNKRMKKKMMIKRRKAKMRRRLTSLLLLALIFVGVYLYVNNDEGIRLDVPLISQMPELQNGCEITSTAMLLGYKDIYVDKVKLAEEMKKDNTEITRNEEGVIEKWGNPEKGFVGDVTGSDDIGYSIDPVALVPLINKYYEKGALDLTGTSTSELEKSLKNGNPIVIWFTSDFSRPKEFEYWEDSEGKEIKAYFMIHAILLTGYDKDYFYYNDPLNNKKDEKISKGTFKAIWREMGEKALTVN